VVGSAAVKVTPPTTGISGTRFFENACPSFGDVIVTDVDEAVATPTRSASAAGTSTASALALLTMRLLSTGAEGAHERSFPGTRDLAGRKNLHPRVWRASPLDGC